MRPALGVSTSTFVVVLAAVLETTSLAGCASGNEIFFRSRADLANAAPIDHVLVLADIEESWVGHKMYVGFEGGLTNRLTACGVKSTILHPETMELDPQQRMATAMQELQTGAAMSIKPTCDGSILRGQASTEKDLMFELKLFDIKSKKMTWLAKSKFHVTMDNVGANDAHSGVDFATSIVSQLRADGVLTGCPTIAAGWPQIKPFPGCMEERRQALVDAAKITDQYLRMKAFKSVPTCE